jgi:hypothetical protein
VRALIERPLNVPPADLPTTAHSVGPMRLAVAAGTGALAGAAIARRAGRLRHFEASRSNQLGVTRPDDFPPFQR